MHTTLAWLAALCLLPLALPRTSASPAQEPKPQDPKPAAAVPALEPGKMDRALLQQLQWLSGTWVIEQDGKTTEEHWRPLQGTMLLGTSHSFDANRTSFFEFLRIQWSRGTIAYLAMPGGRPPISFPLVRISEREVVFENPAHDHPQRIRYERTETGVTATVSLLDGTKAQTFAFRKRD